MFLKNLKNSQEKKSKPSLNRMNLGESRIFSTFFIPFHRLPTFHPSTKKRSVTFIFVYRNGLDSLTRNILNLGKIKIILTIISIETGSVQRLG
jgi:hypothetical protein